ncbi:hypothetical protein A2W54_04105 [Candidatus Giovannonibacteria bacterium RIFCSPHIGHO2_02_43_13]|uniref:Uncharacterized protein n=1 Tax=Candidatus Giovannonibacteria bacterium RIFCSPHIGHO2_02_43_13 TaxID=1798330 RepID=A0A1F5WT19_9BACT|nr:MAG: hypothetical protein A3E06_04220 [Candidatus Giovannonibacteria bacterium RIFCSPHIGHO2_12_FULL_44_42]OGF78785.1 MAG: hypothetical protein A2W54_04105 [Candidatus Giovannonibacteria bacterium RIFCSPHIGHO2_02_43_13]OGF90351.1 MAG: hypothetical protein A3I94_02085 [Candidatus Giovannonibacteria bacterium RIFCSPLOWO2_02_FULL_43_54]
MFGGGQKEEKEPSKDGKLADLKSRRNALSRWMASPDKHPDDANQLEKLDKEIERLEEIKKLEEKAN